MVVTGWDYCRLRDGSILANKTKCENEHKEWLGLNFPVNRNPDLEAFQTESKSNFWLILFIVIIVVCNVVSLLCKKRHQFLDNTIHCACDNLSETRSACLSP